MTPDRSSPVRFAILGAAKIARTNAPRIQASVGAELAAVASRDSEKSAAFAREFQIPTSFGSYQEAIDSPEVDAVYMPLPPSIHLEWITKAAEAGKHIVCEKPLARNASEAGEIIEVCRSNGVVLLDGVMWYHTPRAKNMLEFVRSGQLGDIRQLTSVFTFRWDAVPMDNIRMQRDMGGGSLLDLGWYCVGAALWLLDEIPTSVYATAQWLNDVDMRLNGFLHFNSGVTATIESGFDTVKRRWFELAGTKKNLVCDDFTRPWKSDRARYWTHDSDGNADEKLVPQKNQEEYMFEAFCDLIRNGTVDHEWLELSLKTQVVCDALDVSAREERPVDLSIF